jgi:hypothetical protein
MKRLLTGLLILAVLAQAAPCGPTVKESLIVQPAATLGLVAMGAATATLTGLAINGLCVRNPQAKRTVNTVLTVTAAVALATMAGMTNVALAPAASEPIDQTPVAASNVPVLGNAAVPVGMRSSAGSWFVTCTPVASSAPMLLAVILNWTGCPAVGTTEDEASEPVARNLGIVTRGEDLVASRHPLVANAHGDRLVGFGGGGLAGGSDLGTKAGNPSSDRSLLSKPLFEFSRFGRELRDFRVLLGSPLFHLGEIFEEARHGGGTVLKLVDFAGHPWHSRSLRQVAIHRLPSTYGCQVLASPACFYIERAAADVFCRHHDLGAVATRRAFDVPHLLGVARTLR